VIHCLLPAAYCLLPTARMLRTAARHAAQVPPNPIVTLSPSTITGTLRLPFEKVSIHSRSAGSFLTLMYRNGTLRLAKSSRAAVV